MQCSTTLNQITYQWGLEISWHVVISGSKAIQDADAFASELNFTIDVKTTSSKKLNLNYSNKWFAKSVKLKQAPAMPAKYIKLNASGMLSWKYVKLKVYFDDVHERRKAKQFTHDTSPKDVSLSNLRTPRQPKSLNKPPFTSSKSEMASKVQFTVWRYLQKTLN